MQKSESIAELAKALAAFHLEVKQPLKDKANPFFKSKYVPLENVVEAITDIAPKHGLSFMQYPINQENKVGIVTILIHSSGEYIETEPIFAQPAKNDPQATGSVITYLKRYSLSAVFGITSDEDDDGNSATFGASQQKQQSQPKTHSPKMISTAQIKAIGTKTSNISKRDGVDQKQVYQSAAAHLKIDKSTKELTSHEASKIIEYLSTLE